MATRRCRRRSATHSPRPSSGSIAAARLADPTARVPPAAAHQQWPARNADARDSATSIRRTASGDNRSQASSKSMRAARTYCKASSCSRSASCCRSRHSTSSSWRSSRSRSASARLMVRTRDRCTIVSPTHPAPTARVATTCTSVEVRGRMAGTKCPGAMRVPLRRRDDWIDRDAGRPALRSPDRRGSRLTACPPIGGQAQCCPPWQSSSQAIMRSRRTTLVSQAAVLRATRTTRCQRRSTYNARSASSAEERRSTKPAHSPITRAGSGWP